MNITLVYIKIKIEFPRIYMRNSIVILKLELLNSETMSTQEPFAPCCPECPACIEEIILDYKQDIENKEMNEARKLQTATYYVNCEIPYAALMRHYQMTGPLEAFWDDGVMSPTVTMTILDSEYITKSLGDDSIVAYLDADNHVVSWRIPKDTQSDEEQSDEDNFNEWM